MNVKNIVPPILFIIFVAFSLWALLIPIVGFYHEIGHALIALIFGVQIVEITPAQVVTGPIENPLVLLIVRLAGGFFQALFPILIFICIDLMSRGYLFNFMKKYRLIVLIVISLELALLTHSIYGIVNGVVEGFFPEVYAVIYNNLLLWGSVFLLSAIISSIWLYKRWHTF